ncbi:MAG: hypothetical protein ACYS8W_08025 [Planctomycetota bacterium]
MRAVLIAILLVTAMTVTTGCHRLGHVLVAGAAVGLAASHVAHRAHYNYQDRYYSDRYYYDRAYYPSGHVYYDVAYPATCGTVIYDHRPSSRVYHRTSPRTVYVPRSRTAPSTRRVPAMRPPVRYTSPRPASRGHVSTRWTR